MHLSSTADTEVGADGTAPGPGPGPGPADQQLLRELLHELAAPDLTIKL